MSIDLTIRFPSEEAMMQFCTWMCDGSGEDSFYQFCEMHTADTGVSPMRFHYHRENPAFPENDKRRYGPFMADRLIVVN